MVRNTHNAPVPCDVSESLASDVTAKGATKNLGYLPTINNDTSPTIAYWVE